MAAVSIITPAYNAGPFIAETIASARAQTYRDWEMIVMDDGSADDTVDSARAAAAGDKRVRVYTSDHSGLPAVARNRALRKARGKYIAFLDADDVWMPQKLERQLGALRGKCAWCFANSLFFSGGRFSPDGLKYSRQWRPSRPFFPELFTTEGVPFLTVIVHRELLNAVREKGRVFDEHPGMKAVEDWDFTLRLARKAEPLYIHKPLANYRAHPSGISKEWELNFLRTRRVIRKYRGLGVNRGLCGKAYRLQLSKRAAERMLRGDSSWRLDLLGTCIPPESPRDALLGVMPFLPAPLARGLYAHGIRKKRS